MKKIYLSCTLFLASLILAQDKFTLTCEEGLSQFVISKVDNKSKNEIYDKSIEWIKKNYKVPDKVILSTVTNDYIRFEAITDSFDCNSLLGSIVCMTVKYEIEISIKDNKYKFEIIKLSNLSSGRYGIKSWEDITSSYGPHNKRFFKKNCEPTGRFEKTYEYPANFLNTLNASILNYITETNKITKDNW